MPQITLPTNLNQPIAQDCLFTWSHVTRGGDRIPPDDYLPGIQKFAISLSAIMVAHGLTEFQVNSWYRPADAMRRRSMKKGEYLDPPSPDRSTHAQGRAVDLAPHPTEKQPLQWLHRLRRAVEEEWWDHGVVIVVAQQRYAHIDNLWPYECISRCDQGRVVSRSLTRRGCHN